MRADEAVSLPDGTAPLNGEPARVRRWPHWPKLAGVVGVVVSLMVFGLLRYREYQLAETKFLLNAQKRAEVLQNAFQDQFASVRALSAFYGASNVVEREEFRVYAQALLADHPGIDSLVWVPNVAAADRQRHEEAARMEGAESYSLLERTPNGRLETAGDRDRYLPIYFLESTGPTGELLGIDLGADPVKRRMFDESARTGALVAGPCMPPEPEDDRDHHLLVVMPVFENPVPALPAEPQPSELKGFAVGLFHFDAIIESALAYLDPAGIDIYLFASGDGGRPERIHTYRSKLRTGAFEPRTRMPDAETNELLLVRQFHAGMNGWTVVCEPIDDYLKTHRSWIPWAALTSGLLLTGLLMSYLTLLTREATEIERIASRRALELQTISNTMFDAVLMMDPHGKVAHWNPAAQRIFGYRPEEIIGRSVHETLVPGKYRELAQQGVHRFGIAGRGNVVGRLVEMSALRKNGEEFPIEISIAPIRLRDGWWAVAIVRDITRRKQSEDALRRERRLLRQMLHLQERDRQLVSYEIHDGLAQQLAAAVMKFQALRGLPAQPSPEADELFDETQALLSESLKETRRLIGGLRPPILDQAGVVAAIDNLVIEQNQRGRAAIEFVHDVHFDRLPPPLEIAVFRVVQEALNNACRYSQSDRIRVALSQPNGTVCIEVRDWGVGFAAAEAQPGHYGLQGMRERARLLGGSAEILSQPGEGVAVRVELPIVKEDRPLDEIDDV